MKKNMGTADRIIRVAFVLVIAALFYTNLVKGLLVYVLAAIAIIFLLTGLLGTCPLYSLIGITTCSKKREEQEK